MKSIANMFALTVLFLPPTAPGQSFSGQVDSQWSAPKTVFKRIDATLHAGETITLQVSGTICSPHDHHTETHGWWPFQSDVTIDRCNQVTYNTSHVQVRLAKNEPDAQSESLIPIPPGGQSVTIEAGSKGIQTRADVQAWVASIADANRGRSHGTFAIQGELDVQGRVERLQTFLNTGRRNASVLANDDVLCIHLRDRAPKQVANLVAAHVDYPGANWSFGEQESLLRLALQVDSDCTRALERLTKLYIDNGKFEQANQELKGRMTDLRAKLLAKPDAPDLNAQYAVVLMQAAQVYVQRQLGVDGAAMQKANVLLADAVKHFEKGADGIGVRDALVFRARVLRRLRFGESIGSDGKHNPSALETAVECLERARQLTPRDDDTMPLATSPDGRFLLTCAPRIGILAVPANGTLETGKLYMDSEGLKLLPLSISSSGAVLARRGAADVGWWRPVGSNSNYSFRSIGTARAIKGFAEGDSAIVWTRDNTLVIFSPNNAPCSRKLTENDLLIDMAVTSDGSRCALSFGSTNFMDPVGKIQVFSTSDGVINTVIDTIKFERPANSLAFSPDGSQLLAFQTPFFGAPRRTPPFDMVGKTPPVWWKIKIGSAERQSLILKTNLLPPSPFLPPPGTPFDVASLFNLSENRSSSFSPDGKRIFISNIHAGLAVFDANTLEHQRTVTFQSWPQFTSKTSHRWSEGNILVTTDSANFRPGERLPELKAAVVRGGDLEVLKEEGINGGLFADNLSDAVGHLSWINDKFVAYVPTMRNDYFVSAVTNQNGLPQVVRTLPSARAPLNRLFGPGLNFGPVPMFSLVRTLLNSGKYAVFDDMALELKVVDLETGTVVLRDQSPAGFCAFADGMSWATVGPPAYGTNCTVRIRRGLESKAEFQALPQTLRPGVFFMPPDFSANRIEAFPTISSGAPLVGASGGFAEDWEWHGAEGNKLANYHLEAKPANGVYESPLASFYFGTPCVLMLVQPYAPGSSTDVILKQSGRPDKKVTTFSPLPAATQGRIDCISSASSRRFCLLESRAPQPQTLGLPPPFRFSGARIFDIAANGSVSEKTLTCISKFDRSIYTSRFPGQPEVRFDSELKTLLLPDGERIKVVSLDEDKVIGSLPLGTPIDVQPSFAILLDSEQRMQIARWK